MSEQAVAGALLSAAVAQSGRGRAHVPTYQRAHVPTCPQGSARAVALTIPNNSLEM